MGQTGSETFGFFALSGEIAAAHHQSHGLPESRAPQAARARESGPDYRGGGPYRVARFVM
jgi:hypothetical protein